MRYKKTYSLFRLDYRQKYLGLRIEPIKTVIAEDEGINNLTEAYKYFGKEIWNIESDVIRYSTMDHIEREGEHFGYFITIGLRQYYEFDDLF
jgi:hypothetical protein